MLIPKGDFQTGEALGELPQDKQVVLYCKTGVRSAEVLALVHGAGLADAVHVGGGVSAPGSARSTPPNRLTESTVGSLDRLPALRRREEERHPRPFSTPAA